MHLGLARNLCGTHKTRTGAHTYPLSRDRAFAHPVILLEMALPNHVERTSREGTLFGVPLGDLGLFQSILMGLATGFAAFFFATALAIFGMLFYTAATHHTPDFALTYKRIGLPFGLLVGIAALSYLGFLWVRRILRKGGRR